MAIYQGNTKVSGISQIRYYDLGGICNTAANEAAKEIIIDNFVLTSGVTIKALFTNSNTELSPTITVKDSNGNVKASGIAIKATHAGSKIDLVTHSGKWRGADTYTDEMWQAYTTLELIYDGTDFVIIGNPLFESYVSEDGTSGYSVYADGLIEQGGKSEITSNDCVIPIPVQINHYCNVSAIPCGTESGIIGGQATSFITAKNVASLIHVYGFVGGTSAGGIGNCYWQAKGY